MNAISFISGVIIGMIAGMVTMALCNISKRSDEKMNKININEIKCHKLMIAKCGLLSLSCEVDPITESFLYEIKSDNEILATTSVLKIAIEEYNKYL